MFLNLVYISLLFAAFEARDAVIIGKSVFQETDDWREPIGNFIVANKADVDIQAGHHITLKSGTSIKAGSRCRLHIQNDFVCTQAVFRPVATTEQIPEIAPYDEQYIQTFLSQKSESINQKESDDEAIHIFPNPSNTGIFDCKIISNDATNKTIVVTNVMGQIVEQINVLQNNYVINLSAHSKGLYVVQCVTQHRVFTKKIIYE